MATQIFEKDFGVRPLFTARKFFEWESIGDDDRCFVACAAISAYLTQPDIGVYMQTDRGDNRVSYKIDEPLVYDPRLADDRKQQFKRAVKALRLDAPCTHTYLESQVIEQYCRAKSGGEECTHGVCRTKKTTDWEPTLRILESGEL